MGQLFANLRAKRQLASLMDRVDGQTAQLMADASDSCPTVMHMCDSEGKQGGLGWGGSVHDLGCLHSVCKSRR